MNEKLDTAGIFERLFEVYKAQFSLLFPAAVIVFLPVALLNGAFVAGGGVGLLLVGAVISIVAGFWLQGMVIEAVRDIQDGKRDFTLGGLFRSVAPVLPLLIGIGILTGIGIAIGLVLLIVPGLILITWWSVVAPVVVVERRGFDAFGRSRNLVRGNAWQVFGVIVVVFIIQLVANALLRAIFGDDSFVGQSIASLLSGALIGPVSAIAAALVYLELRRLKGEGTPHAEGIPAAAEPSPFGASPEAPPAPQAPGTTPPAL
ncbi:MAG TPA: hypothetical protein VGW10_00850 [Solirubrobacteraceae bacterium]|nr:hypothetical protein [Solirubrobacteraceae bacterium]